MAPTERNYELVYNGLSEQHLIRSTDLPFWDMVSEADRAF